jgi:hypothetical protein
LTFVGDWGLKNQAGRNFERNISVTSIILFANLYLAPV